jgi:hypothetical protein
MRKQQHPPSLKGYRQTSSILVDPGGSWSALFETGAIVRFVASDTRYRYNAANPMKTSENLYLNPGTVLYGELRYRSFASCGRAALTKTRSEAAAAWK